MKESIDYNKRIQRSTDYNKREYLPDKKIK